MSVGAGAFMTGCGADTGTAGVGAEAKVEAGIVGAGIGVGTTETG